MASENHTGFLTVRAGTFGRTMRATHEGAYRAMDISNCPVTRWTVFGSGDDKLDGRSFRTDERLHISIMEAKPELLWEEDPEKIGALNTDSMSAHLYLQPDAFAHFWAAAEATHGSARSMEIELKPGGQDYLNVMDVGLIESMPGSPMHPVVAELRTMRQQLSRSLVVAFCALVAVWILLKLFH